MHSSRSENNGLAILTNKDLHIYSVGISTGGIAEMRMAESNSQRTIVATTLDEKGAHFAKQQIETKKCSQQIHVKIEDVSKTLPYKNNSYDFIYARLVLHYLSKNELICALKELYRVLKEEGHLFIVVRSSECYEAKDIHSEYNPETGLTTYTSDDGKMYSRFFHTEKSIQHYVKAAGFTIVNVTSYQEQLCIDFQRHVLSPFIDHLIEVVCKK